MKMIEDLGIIYATEKSKKRTHHAIYECPYCGKHFRVGVAYVKRGRKSCGCHIRALTIARNTKHGLKHSRIYRIWHAMKLRCYDEDHGAYPTYGGRGITVCDEWKNDVLCFNEWALNNGYSDCFVIDRIDPDGNYCPENCRWITQQENAARRRKSKNNTTGYVGVRRTKNGWYADIMVKGQITCFGTFKDKNEAAKIRNEYIIANSLPHVLNDISNE